MTSAHIPAGIDGSVLELYLNDHLAGAAAGKSRIAHMAKAHADLPIVDDLRRLSDEISEEYDRVAALIHELGLHRLYYRQAMTAVGERAGRVKFNRRLFQRSPMTPVLELEFMRGAVSAKLGLWDLFEKIGPECGLDASEFSERASLGRDQLARLEAMHKTIAADAFHGEA